VAVPVVVGQWLLVIDLSIAYDHLQNAGWTLFLPERARAAGFAARSISGQVCTTFKREFAADLLQVQQSATIDSLFGCYASPGLDAYRQAQTVARAAFPPAAREASDLSAGAFDRMATCSRGGDRHARSRRFESCRGRVLPRPHRFADLIRNG
jgi:hypothetical protein